MRFVKSPFCISRQLDKLFSLLILNRYIIGPSAMLTRESLISRDGGMSRESVDLMGMKSKVFDS
jgi:hypothetical protein